ncbi:hypothetical protein [Flavobacterium sp. CFS9]|uniref:hypothetical protein n=1 Tax=Flavobacterium sp. CFS9 TaxID=3143118 RepID=UPI0034E8C18F
MDISNHITNNKNWWFKILLSSFIISFIFPVILYKDKSSTYNVITNSFGSIVGGLVFFALVYLITRLFKKRLSDNQIKTVLLISFSFWWILQILNHYNFKIAL